MTRLHVVDTALALPRAHRARLVRHPQVHGEGARRAGECIPGLGPIGGGEHTLSRLIRVRGRFRFKIRVRGKPNPSPKPKPNPSPDSNSLTARAPGAAPLG